MRVKEFLEILSEKLNLKILSFIRKLLILEQKKI